MHVLVAGAAGFIGVHLCRRLLADGHDVLGVDSFATGQRRNAADLAAEPRFRFIEHDVIRPLPVADRVDRVYNLACPASPVDFAGKSLEIMDVCSQGVRNLLDFCLRSGARLLHASTSEVYGNPREHPQRETYFGNVNPIGPRACYDEGKRFAEALIACYRARHGVEARVARIFNTYGPRMRVDDGRVLPNFIRQALAARPLTVHGDGSQTRSFCYVSDLVEGLILLAESAADGPVNLGNPTEIPIAEFARKIIQLTGGRSELSFVPRPADDPDLRRPDISRAQSLLGWSPKVSLDDGLRATVAAFQRDSV